ncbi:MAG: nucleoside hydrolase [Oscillospiraceae bacterium]
MSDTIPVIIDTDPGVDDAIAIMLAAASGTLDIRGITAVDGNVKAVHTRQNALDIADFLGIDCPVSCGAERQLSVQISEHGESIHGETGMGGVSLPRSSRPFDSRDAWDFIFDIASELKGKLVIIAIGPLTDIALALRAHPTLNSLVSRLVVMGGGIEKGNRTPYAEFNFWADPPAAKEVFESGIPIVMAGLNVTLKTGVPISLLHELSLRPSRMNGILRKLSDGYSDRVAGNGDCAVSIIHDAIAVFYAAHPEWCETRECKITVNAVEGDEHWGESVADFSDPSQFNTTLITDIEMEKYLAFYEEMIAFFSR